MDAVERNKKISRRKFLELTALGLGAAAGIHILRTELLPPYGISIPNEKLLVLALPTLLARILQGELFFGPHALERETPRDDLVWTAIDDLRNIIGREDSIGVFETLEDFSYPNRLERFLQRVVEIHDRGGPTPMLNLGFSKTINGTHPLHKKNRDEVETILVNVFSSLAQLNFAHHVRLDFEFNGEWFVHGRGRGLSDLEHEAAVRHFFIQASRICQTHDSQGDLVISPNVEREILGYVPLREKALDTSLNRNDEQAILAVTDLANPRDAERLRTHLQVQKNRLANHLDMISGNGEEILRSGEDVIVMAGLDGYLWFPGKGKLGKVGYWVPGYNITPEELFMPWYIDLALGFPDLPKIICEAGVITMDPEVMLKIFLITTAMGSSGLMPFIVNKEPGSSLHESMDVRATNWVRSVSAFQPIGSIFSQIGSTTKLG